MILGLCQNLKRPGARTPIRKRVWALKLDVRGALDFFAVFPWFAFCISGWTVGSSLLALGLTVTQALISVVIAEAAVAVSLSPFSRIYDESGDAENLVLTGPADHRRNARR